MKYTILSGFGMQLRPGASPEAQRLVNNHVGGLTKGIFTELERVEAANQYWDSLEGYWGGVDLLDTNTMYGRIYNHVSGAMTVWGRIMEEDGEWAYPERTFEDAPESGFWRWFTNDEPLFEEYNIPTGGIAKFEKIAL